MKDMEELNLKIEQNEKITLIANESNRNLIISVIPVKPKRKVIDVFIIGKKNFLLVEQHINIENLYFRFEKESAQ